MCAICASASRRAVMSSWVDKEPPPGSGWCNTEMILPSRVAGSHATARAFALPPAAAPRTWTNIVTKMAVAARYSNDVRMAYPEEKYRRPNHTFPKIVYWRRSTSAHRRPCRTPNGNCSPQRLKRSYCMRTNRGSGPRCRAPQWPPLHRIVPRAGGWARENKFQNRITSPIADRKCENVTARTLVWT